MSVPFAIPAVTGVGVRVGGLETLGCTKLLVPPANKDSNMSEMGWASSWTFGERGKVNDASLQIDSNGDVQFCRVRRE